MRSGSRQHQAAPPAAKPRPKPTTNHPQEPAFIAVSHLHGLNLLPGQKPKQLRLPDGTIKVITTWKAVLLEVCRLVLATNDHLPIPFSDKAGKKRFLISIEKQPVGASTGVTYQGKIVFVGTNYSRKITLPMPCTRLNSCPPATNQHHCPLLFKHGHRSTMPALTRLFLGAAAAALLSTTGASAQARLTGGRAR